MDQDPKNKVVSQATSGGCCLFYQRQYGYLLGTNECYGSPSAIYVADPNSKQAKLYTKLPDLPRDILDPYFLLDTKLVYYGNQVVLGVKLGDYVPLHKAHESDGLSPQALLHVLQQIIRALTLAESIRGIRYTFDRHNIFVNSRGDVKLSAVGFQKGKSTPVFDMIIEEFQCVWMRLWPSDMKYIDSITKEDSEHLYLLRKFHENYFRSRAKFSYIISLFALEPNDEERIIPNAITQRCVQMDGAYARALGMELHRSLYPEEWSSVSSINGKW